MTNRQRLLLYATALATVLAAIFAPPREETVQPSRAQSASILDANTSVLATPAKTGFLPKKRNGLTGEPGNLFQVDRPPPPPKALAARPAKPVAPPLPYVYMGKMLERGELTIFLTRQDKPYVVHAGDVLDNQYRVDAIHPPVVELTYLPLKQKQVLNIGASK